MSSLLFMAVGKEVLWEQRAELGELQAWYPLTHIALQLCFKYCALKYLSSFGARILDYLVGKRREFLEGYVSPPLPFLCETWMFYRQSLFKMQRS